MPQITISHDYFNIILHDKFLSWSLDADGNTWKNLTITDCSQKVQKQGDDDSNSIQCVSSSPCGKYFAVCYNKDLYIYNTSDWGLVCSGAAERKANSIQFFPKSNTLLVADKSGIVTFYSYSKGNLTKTEHVIGHNSMLTGALVTEDENYIITCDRDEKIRVTNYPNVYNIKSYCLGHEQFITSIAILPSDRRILVSTSGDGTVRLWDYVTGKQLHLYIDEINQKDEKVPFVRISCCKKESNSLIAAQQYKTNQITILIVKGSLDSNLVVECNKILELSKVPWDITFWHECLISLVPDKTPLKFWSCQEDNSLEKSFETVIKYLTDNWELLNEACNRDFDLIPILFKREIDNVQEYQQKKRARLLKNDKNVQDDSI